MSIEPVENLWSFKNEPIPQAVRDQLIIKFTPLVRYVASRIAMHLPNHIEVDDLVSSGIFGLMDAIGKFDPSMNVKFKTYAELRIRGAIYDSLRELDWIPRSVRRKQKELEQVYRKLEQSLGRPATDEDVAKNMKISITELHKLIDQIGGLSLGIFKTIPESGNDEDSENIIEFVPDTNEKNPACICEKKQLQSILGDMIDTLPPKEKLVVSLYYYEELTMKEIGTVMSITESRVSQLHTRAMLRLRGRLKNVLSRNR